MEKMNLSLKSIYRLLMTNDFPIYSESVIDEKNRKGQTLLKFWQSLVASEFRSLPCGQIIWRNDGRRNRYISNLCNRNPEMKLYPEYAKELASQLSTATLLNQIQRFSVFLSGRNYKHDILLRRIRELMRLTQTDDPHVSHAIAEQIEDAISWQDGDSNKSLFQASYLLTVLMLYAAAGEAMDDSAMDALRTKDFSISALWDLKLNPPAAADASMTYLTERVGMLQDKPLPHQRFFGREEELFNLKEMAVQGRKCLISGVGGIGKTELLRQLIQRCEEEQSIDCIAIVPYAAGIVESFGKVFPGFRLQEAEESFHHILYQLEQKAAEGKRVLLLVDNMNSSLEEDQALSRLAALSCAVLISSRRPELEGFETYRISDPSVTTCSLIFRDNYGKPLTHEDRAVLDDLLRKGSLRHPLTLRLMARAAHSNGWTVQGLRDQLLQSQISLSWVEDDHPVKLDQIYHQLYSYTQIPNSCKKLVELFTLLPLDSYSPEFLANVFAPVTAGDDLTYRLNLLAEGGWLDETDNGYAMHPLVAQCLRRKVLNEKKLEYILQNLFQKLPKYTHTVHWKTTDNSIRRIAEIVLYVADMITGSVSNELMLNMMVSMRLLFPTVQQQEHYTKVLLKNRKHCNDWDDVLDAYMCTVLGPWNRTDVETVERVFRKQQTSRSISDELYIDFCLHAPGNHIISQHPSLSEEILNEVLTGNSTPSQYATAYYNLSVLFMRIGKLDRAYELTERGAEYVMANPECADACSIPILINLSAFYSKYGQREKAEHILKELTSKLDGTHNPIWKMQLLDLLANHNLNGGNNESALEQFKELQTMTCKYFGYETNYYTILGQIGVCNHRMKRYKQAQAYYEQVISYAKKNGPESLLAMYSINLASCYLEQKIVYEAIPIIEYVISFGRNAGFLYLAEGLRNMARAHGLLGEYEKERECLSEAVPLLEAVYGPQHSRAEAARKRLEELTSGEG